MVLTDPTMYPKEPLTAFIKAMATTVILSFSTLLRKSSFLEKQRKKRQYNH